MKQEEIHVMARHAVMVVSIAAAQLSLLALGSCSSSETTPVHVVTLASGKEIKILSSKIGYLDEGGRAILLTYESELPFDNRPVLLRELKEIWDEFRPNAEKEGVRLVTLTAQSPPRGFLSRREAFQISIERNMDGTWGKH